MIQVVRVVSKEDIQSKKDPQKVRVYRLEGISEKQAKFLAERLFCESINQQYSINKPLLKGKNVIEIAYKPGVMNPESASIIKAASDLKITLQAADSSWEYHFKKKVNGDRLNLYNPTVEHIVTADPKTLLIQGTIGKTATIPLRSMNDDELLKTSKEALFLNLEEMKIIQRYFQQIKRDPTDIELETLAQTWSEHCAHKTFKANLIIDGRKKESLMKRIKTEALKYKKNIVSAFVDNSGVMDFYDGYAICGKVETHNSPSAIEPYGGAMTGSGGVFRDVLGTGQGAKTIASTDIFCFAYPHLPKKMLPPGCLAPDYLLKRVVEGVRDYGNRMGIPTNNGSIHFHNDFRAKPSVIVGAYGMIKKSKAQKGQAKKGDVVVAVGGRTGRDGIHGATFSSGEMNAKTMTVHSSAVQIGNAIEEKRMFDAILEASDAGYIRAIQDCGAGGFSSAIGEMGEETGVRIDLQKAPLKYSGLAPWEIWVSESQERMALAIPKPKLKKFLGVCKKYNVEAAVLGSFDSSKKLQVYFGKELVCLLDMKFLHHGLSQRIMRADRPKGQPKKSEKEIAMPKTNTQWISTITQVLSDQNICSKEPIVRLYDHTVQGTNGLQPFVGKKLDGPTDAAVIRPLLHKSYAMIISHGLNPILNRIDPYHGSIWASVEALSNYVAVGGDYEHASLINNYIWPFPDSESLWSLDRSVDAVVDVMKAFRIPVISGKDSLSSTYRDPKGTVLKIPPVLCMSVFGKIADISKTISSDLKKKDSTLVLVGKQDTAAMAGSVYLQTRGLIGKQIPHIDISKLPNLFSQIYKGIQAGDILSCHDVSEGGIVTALFEMGIGGRCGAEIDIPAQKRPDHFLFNETAGTFIVEVETGEIAKKLFQNSSYVILGKTTEKTEIVASLKSKKIFNVNLLTLEKAWKKPMQKLFV